MTKSDWFAPALLGVGLITAARIILLALNKTDLFVDEAQYWLWGQDLAFGYYSKPPMIGWVIRAFTEIGSDAPFWIRLPGPLFHAATALILGNIAAQISDTRSAILVTLAYATLPMVALASLLISTDTIMFPFLAAAAAGYLRLLNRPSLSIAALTGLALGLAFLSKYAAIYYVICAAIAMLALPTARLNARLIATLLAAFLVTISPNLIWNLANGLTTVQHTLDNADWVRNPGEKAALNLAGLAEFFASQFAVFGPVLFAALLIMTTTWPRLPQALKLLLIFSLPIIAIVCIQALLSRAYANWAAAAYLTGTLATVLWLSNKNRLWLAASFVINGTLCLILPLATTVADTLKLGRDQPLLERYIGRTAMTNAILQTAHDQGLTTIVATDRDILADLFYSARDTDFEIFALPPKGRAPHHYALRFPYAPGARDILLVTRTTDPAPCAANLLKEIAPTSGAYRKHPQSLFLAPGNCSAP